ncbi:hypothetical protein PF007_g13323 [Phytophthora fragariae]|uniref:Uncharacterized protein n=1 Tax=Phytophthora fragariae TaxID=53985 RepID=A0A6A3ERR7_9STRA|nr:hypothetical protein PF009_g14926 [Phytophthora fragariae]KAE9106676.1 hypothetical protein PF007_g13323 [Phytophthora fragariae]KAE9143065.1 hypothetical protein PF006_g11886 [Phytophthora fragariae]
MRIARPVIALVLVTDRECAACPSSAAANNTSPSSIAWVRSLSTREATQATFACVLSGGESCR